MKTIALTIFSLICLACLNIDKQTKYVSIEIINNSYLEVDTLVYQLNNFSNYVLKIKNGDTLSLKINKDSIKTYGDFHFDCWVYFKTSNPLNLAKYQMYYDDLGGSLDDKYTIILNKDTTISIIPQAFNAFMNKRFGNPTLNITAAQINGSRTVLNNFLQNLRTQNKHGIYTLVTSGGSYSGHVDLMTFGKCLGGYALPKDINLIEKIEIWILQ